MYLKLLRPQRDTVSYYNVHNPRLIYTVSLATTLLALEDSSLGLRVELTVMLRGRLLACGEGCERSGYAVEEHFLKWVRMLLLWLKRRPHLEHA